MLVVTPRIRLLVSLDAVANEAATVRDEVKTRFEKRRSTWKRSSSGHRWQQTRHDERVKALNAVIEAAREAAARV